MLDLVGVHAAVKPPEKQLAVRMPNKEAILAALMLLARVPALRQIATGATLEPTLEIPVALNPTLILVAARMQEGTAHALR
jgi:hypothetical protein